MSTFAETLQNVNKQVQIYIEDYQQWFGRLPGEEGLTDFLSTVYVMEMEELIENVTTQDKIGDILVGSRQETPLESIIQRISDIMKRTQKYRLIFPTRHAERRVGWDFGWTLNLGGGTKTFIFVQAKNVTYPKENCPEIHFDYGKENPQSEIFGQWLQEANKNFTPAGGFQVEGWYLLYGVKQAPVAWIRWEDFFALKHLESTDNLSSRVVKQALLKKEQPLSMENLPIGQAVEKPPNLKQPSRLGKDSSRAGGNESRPEKMSKLQKKGQEKLDMWIQRAANPDGTLFNMHVNT
ncbi:hypothetical protein BDV93DRAFT_612165 [Ceratobasidium sp. AG-I]|nr:hypothetical protein BDV93DRAFT_612165 [Ceratobasidium sp. AG-I]